MKDVFKEEIIFGRAYFVFFYLGCGNDTLTFGRFKLSIMYNKQFEVIKRYKVSSMNLYKMWAICPPYEKFESVSSNLLLASKRINNSYSPRLHYGTT